MLDLEDIVSWIGRRVPSAVSSIVEAIGNKLGDRYGWPFIIPVGFLFLAWVFSGFVDFGSFSSRGFVVFMPALVALLSCFVLLLITFTVWSRRKQSGFLFGFVLLFLSSGVPWAVLAAYLERDISVIGRLALLAAFVFAVLTPIFIAFERWERWSTAIRVVVILFAVGVVFGARQLPKPPKDPFRIEAVINKYAPPPKKKNSHTNAPNHALQRTAPRVTVAAISYPGVSRPSHLFL